MLARRLLLGLLTAGSLLALSTDASAQKLEVFRYGILGGENEADRLKNFACVKEGLGKVLGIPVELYPAADYAGVMQGLIAGQLEAANMGASAYAGVAIQDPNAIEPILVQQQTDGSLGYHSVLYVRADSGITSLEQLKGKSLAFADPNSASGYLYPAFELKEQGYDPKAFFGKADFAGGHEQGVVAVLNKQFDAGVTWTSGIGDYKKGYTSGNLNKMVTKGALNMDDIRIVWKSSVIPNGPETVRKALPADVKAKFKAFMKDLPKTNYDCFRATQGGDYSGFAEVPAGFYDGAIKLRQEQTKARRG